MQKSTRSGWVQHPCSRLLFRIYNREITFQTGNYTIAWSGNFRLLSTSNIGLGDHLLFLLLGAQIHDVLVFTIIFSFGNLAVRSFDETEVEFTLAYTQSEEIKPMFGPSGVSIGHKSSVVRVVHITNLKTCTLTKDLQVQEQTIRRL